MLRVTACIPAFSRGQRNLVATLEKGRVVLRGRSEPQWPTVIVWVMD